MSESILVFKLHVGLQAVVKSEATQRKPLQISIFHENIKGV